MAAPARARRSSKCAPHQGKPSGPRVTLIRYLHLLSMAFFVGGQLFLVVAVVPSLRPEHDRDRLRAIARRFGWGTLAAIALPIGTGIPLASHFHQWENGTLHVKLAL